MFTAQSMPQSMLTANAVASPYPLDGVFQWPGTAEPDHSGIEKRGPLVETVCAPELAANEVHGAAV